jgi:hypothetical protein
VQKKAIKVSMTPKFFCFSLSVIVCAHQMATAQAPQVGSEAISPAFADSQTLTIHGRTDLTYDNSPYLPNDKWQPGYFVEANGKRFTLKEMRYDNFLGRLEYRENGLLFTPKRKIIEFGFDSGELFQSQFEPFDSHDEETFFQVLYDGKAKVLKHVKLNMVDATPYYSATKVKHFNAFEMYYVVKNKNEIVKSRKQDRKLLAALNDKNQQVQTYIKTNGLKWEKPEDLRKIMSYYEAL